MMENKLDIHAVWGQSRVVDSPVNGCPEWPPKQLSLVKDNMAEEQVKRKLTAILSADVVEYSRLMADDDLATVRTLAMYRETVAKYVTHFRGRVVDSPGDNILAEFASVVDALQCAVEIQRELAERNEALSEDRQMKFRIGINTGDVIQEGERIYGDGVNIAAQLESMANPGEICISGNVHSHVNNKLHFAALL
jgi:class 3 adenylate cyclase